MTVKELIENLKDAPQDAEIWLDQLDLTCFAARSIIMMDADPRVVAIGGANSVGKSTAVLYDETRR